MCYCVSWWLNVLLKVGGLKQQKYVFSQSWGAEIWDQGVGRLVPLGGPEGEPASCLSPRLSWLLATIIPASFSSRPLPCVFVFLLFCETLVTGFRDHQWVQEFSSWSLNCLFKDPEPQVRSWTNFGGSPIQSKTLNFFLFCMAILILYFYGFHFWHAFYMQYKENMQFKE